MEAPFEQKVRASQKDIGLAVIVLGLSFAISFITVLEYLGLVLGLVAIIILLIRRHSLSVTQGKLLYASIIVFTLMIIGIGVAIIVEVISLAGAIIAQGYNQSTFPHWAINQILTFAIVIGIAVAVVEPLCYFMIPYGMTASSARTTLIGGFVVSIGLKIYEIFLLMGTAVTSSSFNFTETLSLIRADPTLMPYIGLSVVSALALGIPMIYVGYLLRIGNLKTLPQKEEEKF